MKDFFKLRESLTENKKTFDRAAKNKDLKKIVKAVEDLGGTRAYPENEGMRDFVTKIIGKAGIKKASQLSFVDDMGLNHVVSNNKKWRKNLYNLEDRKELDKTVGNIVDTYGGFDVFYACLASAYRDNDLVDWNLTGRGLDI